MNSHLPPYVGAMVHYGISCAGGLPEVVGLYKGYLDGDIQLPNGIASLVPPLEEVPMDFEVTDMRVDRCVFGISDLGRGWDVRMEPILFQSASDLCQVYSQLVLYHGFEVPYGFDEATYAYTGPAPLAMGSNLEACHVGRDAESSAKAQ